MSIKVSKRRLNEEKKVNEMTMDPYLRYLVYIGMVILISLLVAVLAYFGLYIDIPPPPPPTIII